MGGGGNYRQSLDRADEPSDHEGSLAGMGDD